MEIKIPSVASMFRQMIATHIEQDKKKYKLKRIPRKRINKGDVKDGK